MKSESPWATKRPIPFTNASGETIPAFAAMAITGLVDENGIAFLVCDKPSTVFVRDYAVNNMFDVPAGLRGTCFRAGDLRVLYDAGSPAAGEGWGPKPAQWSLARGYPGFTIQGAFNSEHRIAKTFFEPIAQLLIKTTAGVAADATTDSYRVYAGAFGSEADAGFTSLPTARNRTGQSIDVDEWGWLHWTNSGWELRCLQNRVYHVSYSGGSLGPGASGSATLPDGRAVTFTNWSVDSTIASSDKILIWQDFTDGGFYGMRAGGGNINRVWYGTADGPISVAGSGTVTKSDSSTPTATNWSNEAPIGANDKVFVWLDSFENNHYCIKAGGAPRWFHARFNSSGLRNSDSSASVLTYEALDGGAHPGVISAAVNKYKLSADGLDECLIVQNLAQGDYQIVQVEHVAKLFATQIEYDPLTDRELKYKRQQFSVMHDDDETDWQSIFIAELRNLVTEVKWDEGGSKKIEYTEHELYTLPDGSVTGTDHDVLTAVQIDIVDNVTFDGDLHKSIRTDGYVLEAPAAASVKVIDFFDQTVIVDVYMSGIDLHRKQRTVKVPEAGAIDDFPVFQGTNCDDPDGDSDGPAGGDPSFVPRAEMARARQSDPEFCFHKRNFTRPTLPL